MEESPGYSNFDKSLGFDEPVLERVMMVCRGGDFGFSPSTSEGGGKGRGETGVRGGRENPDPARFRESGWISLTFPVSASFLLENEYVSTGAIFKIGLGKPGKTGISGRKGWERFSLSAAEYVLFWIFSTDFAGSDWLFSESGSIEILPWETPAEFEYVISTGFVLYEILNVALPEFSGVEVLDPVVGSPETGGRVTSDVEGLGDLDGELSSLPFDVFAFAFLGESGAAVFMGFILSEFCKQITSKKHYKVTKNLIRGL